MADLPTQHFSAGAKSQLTFLTITAWSGADHLQGFKQRGALPLTQSRPWETFQLDCITVCIIVSSFYSSLKSSQSCAKNGQQKEQLPFSWDTTSRQLTCFLFCPAISHKNTFKSQIVSNQLWIFTLKKEGGRWLLSVNFTSWHFKSQTLKSWLGKANEKERGCLFVTVLTENMQKFTVPWGTQVYFQKILALKKYQEQGLGMGADERVQGFQYCYSGLKLVLRLKYIRQLNKEVFSEQTSWTFSVDTHRAHPFKMKCNCKCL